MKIQKAAQLIYIVTTILLIAAFFYTASSYFIIYRGSFGLSIDIQSFDVTILNATHTMTETAVVIRNPSESAFEILHVEERLTHETWGASGPAYILSDIKVFTMPEPLHPSSDVTVTFNVIVQSTKIQTDSTVFAVLTAYLKGPIVGQFLLRSYEVL